MNEIVFYFLLTMSGGAFHAGQAVLIGPFLDKETCNSVRAWEAKQNFWAQVSICWDAPYPVPKALR